MEEKIKAIIFDLDGCLADFGHRAHLLKQEKDVHSQFFSSMFGDKVNKWCKEILNRFKDDYGIIIITGRPDKYRVVTEKWLEENGIIYDALFMRPSKDERLDCLIKEEIYLTNIKDRMDVLFVIDDRLEVVDMWRKNGLICLQPCPGDY